jgi:hypothetical protein
LCPENPEEEQHMALSADQIATTFALLGEELEPALQLIDGELLNQIGQNTSHMDPLEWPKNYELNDEVVLVSKNTGQIWVPLNEELRQEVVVSHPDG